MVRTIALVVVLVLVACKKDKPKVCVMVDACCKSMGGDKPLLSGTAVDDALGKACTGTDGLTQNHCADYAREIKQAFGQAMQNEQAKGIPAPKLTPACREMDPYAE